MASSVVLLLLESISLPFKMEFVLTGVKLWLYNFFACFTPANTATTPTEWKK